MDWFRLHSWKIQEWHGVGNQEKGYYKINTDTIPAYRRGLGYFFYQENHSEEMMLLVLFNGSVII